MSQITLLIMCKTGRFKPLPQRKWPETWPTKAFTFGWRWDELFTTRFSHSRMKDKFHIPIDVVTSDWAVNEQVRR